MQLRPKGYWFNGHCRFYNGRRREAIPPYRGYCEKKDIPCGGILIPVGQYCKDGEYTEKATRTILEAGGSL